MRLAICLRRRLTVSVYYKLHIPLHTCIYYINTIFPHIFLCFLYKNYHLDFKSNGNPPYKSEIIEIFRSLIIIKGFKYFRIKYQSNIKVIEFLNSIGK